MGTSSHQLDVLQVEAVPYSTYEASQTVRAYYYVVTCKKANI